MSQRQLVEQPVIPINSTEKTQNPFAKSPNKTPKTVQPNTGATTNPFVKKSPKNTGTQEISNPLTKTAKKSNVNLPKNIPRARSPPVKNITRVNNTLDLTPVDIPQPAVNDITHFNIVQELTHGKVKDEKVYNPSINYSTFLQLINDDTFLESLRSSLLFSYGYKKNFYIKKLKDAEILEGEDDSGGSYKDDSSKTRKKITNLITIINKRLEEYSDVSVNSRIKENLLSAIEDPNDGLDTLIGRESIKDIIATQVVAFSNNPMTFLGRMNNFALYGPSGVGKTKLGKVLSNFYSKSGLLLKDDFKVVTAAKMVHHHVGFTARMVNNILESMLESVLFIDEAYSFVPDKKLKNHGVEAINEIVGFVDKHLGMGIIIVAGYEQDMKEKFMSINEGLPRRFPNVIILDPYTDEQLTTILLKFISQAYGPLFTQQEANVLYTFINIISKTDPSTFDKQAGDMLILSGDILDAIYSSLSPWSNDINHNAMLMLTGINSFLARKNKSLSFT